MSDKRNILDRDIEPMSRFTLAAVLKALSKVGLPAHIKKLILKELLKNES